MIPSKFLAITTFFGAATLVLIAVDTVLVAEKPAPMSSAPKPADAPVPTTPR